MVKRKGFLGGLGREEPELFPGESFDYYAFDENGKEKELLFKITPVRVKEEDNLTLLYLDITFHGSANDFIRKQKKEALGDIGITEINESKKVLQAKIRGTSFFERIQTNGEWESVFSAHDKNGPEIPRSQRNLEVAGQFYSLRKYLKEMGIVIPRDPLEKMVSHEMDLNLAYEIRIKRQENPFFEYQEYDSLGNKKIEFRIIPKEEIDTFRVTLFLSFKEKEEATRCMEEPSLYLPDKISDEKIQSKALSKDLLGLDHETFFLLEDLSKDDLIEMIRKLVDKGYIAGFDGNKRPQRSQEIAREISGLKAYLRKHEINIPEDLFKPKPTKTENTHEPKYILSLEEVRRKMGGPGGSPPRSGA